MEERHSQGGPAERVCDADERARGEAVGAPCLDDVCSECREVDGEVVCGRALGEVV